MEFNQFKPLFQKHFEEMIESATALYEVNADKEALWNTYLDSFPAGKSIEELMAMAAALD